MAICSCSSWSERPSNWSIGCEEEEEDSDKVDIKEEVEDGRTFEEEAAGLDDGNEKGERRDTPKHGKPVFGF